MTLTPGTPADVTCPNGAVITLMVPRFVSPGLPALTWDMGCDCGQWHHLVAPIRTTRKPNHSPNAQVRHYRFTGKAWWSLDRA